MKMTYRLWPSYDAILRYWIDLESDCLLVRQALRNVERRPTVDSAAVVKQHYCAYSCLFWLRSIPNHLICHTSMLSSFTICRRRLYSYCYYHCSRHSTFQDKLAAYRSRCRQGRVVMIATIDLDNRIDLPLSCRPRGQSARQCIYHLAIRIIVLWNRFQAVFFQ